MTAGVAAASLLAGGPLGASDVPFASAAAISTLGTRPAAVAPADVDGDGDLDLLAGWLDTARLAWLENTNGDGSAWVPRTIADLGGIRAVVGTDVDGDGDLDVVAGAAGSDNVVVWCENTAGNGSAWTLRTIASVPFVFSVDAGDIDGDGDADVLSANHTAAGALRYHENVAGDGSTWALRTIFQGSNIVTAVAADMDGDGDLDAMRSSINEATVAWHDNLLGDGTVWVTRTITTASQSFAVVPVDVDGDGDLDAVTANPVLDLVVWHENLTGSGQAWTTRTLSTSASAFRLQAADLDSDGDPDVMGLNLDPDVIRWHENVAGDGSSWITRTVGATADTPYDATAADFDGDGDLDVASVASFGNEIAWFRNDSIHQTACFGPANTIFNVGSPFGSAAADVDGDGDLDVLLSTWPSGSVHWIRNEAAGASWTPFTLAAGYAAFIVNSGDVDGDGDPDALLGAEPTRPASWVENVLGGAVWSPQPIATPGGTVAPDLKPADVDGDGDLDALGSGGPPGAMTWFENLNGQGDLWAPHLVATASETTIGAPADLDRDGDVDILVQSVGGSGGSLVWYENAAGNGTAWTTRTISTIGASTAVALDLDRDGDLDVVASNNPSFPGMRWHENLDGAGGAWTTHSLSTLVGVAHLQPRDVDGDGDLDLVVGQVTNEGWMERTGAGVTFVLHTIASDLPGTVSSPDLDGDGDPDVLWTGQVANVVAWSRNGRGQVVLELADQVPGSANNNDVFPILRLTIAHGGRAGDSDLELARIGLLFEEGPGDPLTTAEANALVEELRIHRDANGNGTFDPGSDPLLSAVPTLALTAGVQTVGLADGDPNVQVPFGTPRTFFVVAQLTANASQQAPNQFRVTHLAAGASATQAEDRSADIPLTTACPSDFASSMIGPIVPVELMRFTVE